MTDDSSWQTKHAETISLFLGHLNSITDKFVLKGGTATVKRYMINFGNSGKPLKVEVSYRKKSISPDEVVTIGGIAVYNIGSLCVMKASAYAGRDKIRDLSLIPVLFSFHNS